MRVTRVPIGEFLDATLHAADADHRYDGIAVVLDREAEHSGLIDEVVRDAPSLDDVTGREIALIVPGAVQTEVPDRLLLLTKPGETLWDFAGGPGVMLVGGQSLAAGFWDRASDRIDQLHRDTLLQAELADSISESASETSAYLGLHEDDIPSLVLLSLAEREMFVLRFAGGKTAYKFFKQVRERRPQDLGQPWLSHAIRGTAAQHHLQEDTPLALVPERWREWTAVRLRAADVQAVPSSSAPL